MFQRLSTLFRSKLLWRGRDWWTATAGHPIEPDRAAFLDPCIARWKIRDEHDRPTTCSPNCLIIDYVEKSCCLGKWVLGEPDERSLVRHWRGPNLIFLKQVVGLIVHAHFLQFIEGEVVLFHCWLHPAIQGRLTGLFGIISSLNYNFERHSGLGFCIIEGRNLIGDQIGSDKKFISMLYLRQG